MALYFLGKSICPICNEILETNQEIYSFPPFAQNLNDPINFFNDEAFHYKCLLRHPLGPDAIDLSMLFVAKTRPNNRICDIGKNKIENPDDYIFIPLLTSNNKEELHIFNFMAIDKNNIKFWKQKDKFIELASLFHDEGKWRGSSSFNYLNELIIEIGK